MGSQFVDGSPGWGSIFGNVMSGLESAPGKALSNIHAAETIKDQRIKRAREQELYDLNVAARSKLDPAIAPAQAAPTTAYAPFVGDINNPADMAGVPSVSFVDPREQVAAEARRALAVAGGQASIAKDPANWSSQLAYGNTASAGMPQTAQGRAESEFLATGKWPSHIGRDESKNPIKMWVPINEQNEPIGQAVASATDPSRPGQRYGLSSPVSSAQSNPFESDGASRQRLAVIEQEVIKNGGMTTEQARLVPQLIDNISKPKRVREGSGDTARIKIVREVPMSPQHQALYEMATAPPVDGVAPAPRVDPNADRLVSTEPLSAESLRKEYDALPEVKRIVNTVALYNDVAKTATLPTNRVRDLDLVYSFIKTMDDLTGVRDAEVKMVGATGSWDEIKNELMGRARGEGMDNRTRLNILETLKSRIDQYQAAKDVRDAQFRAIATEGGLAHKAVVPDMPTMVTIDPDKVLNAPRGMNVAPPGGGILSGIFGTTDRRATPPPPTRPSDALLGR